MPMICYASRTGSRRNLSALRARGWRLIVSATGVWRTEGFPYAIDNGAWTVFQQNRPFDEAAFKGIVDALWRDADWTVLPDIVGGGAVSLMFSLSWADRVPGKQMLAVQDGMTNEDVRELINCDRGIFVGGSTTFKLSTMAMWAELAHDRDAICHVGRVNSVTRMHQCIAANVDSVDGTSASRFSATTAKLDNASRQTAFSF